jgi:hypothetical protein
MLLKMLDFVLEHQDSIRRDLMLPRVTWGHRK